MNKVKRYLCDLAGTTDDAPMEVIKEKYVVLAYDYDALAQRCRDLSEALETERAAAKAFQDGYDYLRAEVRRGGHVYMQEYAYGKPTSPVSIIGDCDESDHGTTIQFHPDATIFQSTVYQFDILSTRLRDLAYRFSWIQHGRLQIYIMYIVVTLLLLLLWKL